MLNKLIEYIKFSIIFEHELLDIDLESIVVDIREKLLREEFTISETSTKKDFQKIINFRKKDGVDILISTDSIEVNIRHPKLFETEISNYLKYMIDIIETVKSDKVLSNIFSISQLSVNFINSIYLKSVDKLYEYVIPGFIDINGIKNICADLNFESMKDNDSDDGGVTYSNENFVFNIRKRLSYGEVTYKDEKTEKCYRLKLDSYLTEFLDKECNYKDHFRNLIEKLCTYVNNIFVKDFIEKINDTKIIEDENLVLDV